MGSQVFGFRNTTPHRAPWYNNNNNSNNSNSNNGNNGNNGSGSSGSNNGGGMGGGSINGTPTPTMGMHHGNAINGGNNSDTAPLSLPTYTKNVDGSGTNNNNNTNNNNRKNSGNMDNSPRIAKQFGVLGGGVPMSPRDYNIITDGKKLPIDK